MKVSSVFEREDFDQKAKIDIVQCVYDNCWASETILFNAISDISSICGQVGLTTTEKIAEIQGVALDALENSKKQNLTNPDIYAMMNKKGDLLEQARQAQKAARRLIRGRIGKK